MKKYNSNIGMTKLCRLFGKSRQAFYDHNRRASDTHLQEGLVLALVKQVRTLMPRIGCLKLHFMLREKWEQHHIHMGRDRFCALLRENDLMVKRRKRYVRTTHSNHPYKKWPDLTPGLQITGPGQLWVSDITYLETTEGFLYLSLITDTYSHKIVGHHLSQYLKAAGPIHALNKALSSLNAATGNKLIHHSDRGIQYCCQQYIDVLEKHQVQISMTQSGSPYENPVAERVNGILKTELRLDPVFDSYAQAIKATVSAIDTYNRIRPHMSCDNFTPHQAHQLNEPLKKRWKNKKKNTRKANPVSL